MSIQRFSADYCTAEHADREAADFPVEPEADSLGAYVRYADHLAALKAERAKGEIIWELRSHAGRRYLLYEKPDLTKIELRFGFTCRKVRVVEVEE